MKRFLSAMILLSSIIIAQEYHVNKSEDNLVKFISDAPLENFEGVTNYIDGYMYLQSLDDLTDNQIYFEVDLTTLDTGIGLRNRHMRDNYLETNKYRFAFFQGNIGKLEKVLEDEYSAEVKGTMFIHGVTNEITINGSIRKIDSGFFIETEFPISLVDYNIDIPQLMFMKIDEVMQLQLKFYLEKITREEG